MRTLYRYCIAFILNSFLTPFIVMQFLVDGPLGRECVYLRFKVINFLIHDRDLTGLASKVTQLVDNVQYSKDERNLMFVELANSQAESDQSKSFMAKIRKMLKIEREIVKSCNLLTSIAPTFNDEIPELNQLLAEEEINSEHHEKACKQLNFRPHKISSSFIAFVTQCKNDSEIQLFI